jgi:hypothetical protein
VLAITKKSVSEKLISDSLDPARKAVVEFAAVDFPQANRLTVHILAAIAAATVASASARKREHR